MHLLSKLPMRQLTPRPVLRPFWGISKLPMRQLTELLVLQLVLDFSKLPMRQLTVSVNWIAIGLYF